MTEVIDKAENKKGYKKTKLGWIPEDWEVAHLESICDVRDGTHDSPKYFDSGIPFLTSKNLTENGLDFSNINYISEEDYKKFSERSNVDAGDILFGMIGTIGNPTIVKTTRAFSIKNMALIKFFKNSKINNYYLLNIIKSKIVANQFNRTSNEGVQSFISLGKIRKLLIAFPSINEQEKIAEVLSAWNEGIETLEKLIEQKEIQHKTLMKNLLIGKIRLSEFVSKWTHSKFNAVFERITRKNEELNSNILTISAQNGLISQKDFYNKRIAGVDTSKYILLNNGEYAYNKSYSSGYPLGAIKRLDLYTKGVVSSLYICFKLKGQSNCSDFWKYYFEAGILNREIKMIAQEGARNHGLLNIAGEDFFNILLYYPEDNQEQQKIADILNKSEKEIQILNSKLEKLKEQKKGLMQKLLTGQIRVKI